MSRTKQMGYYRYRHWSKLRSSSRSCESCVQNIRRQCSAGRKEFCLKRCLLRKSVHMGEDEPLGTDSRQWAGIIWLMHLLPPPFPFISGFLLLWLYTCLSDEASVLEFVAFCIRAGSSVRPQGPVASGKPEAPPATFLLFEAAILIMRRCSGWKREGGGVCIM